MNHHPLIKATPWDTAVFGIPTWELSEYSAAALQQASQMAGHHTIKVEPLADKRLLHEFGFYYCDTLIEPYCNAAQLRIALHPDAAISKEIDTEQVQAICHDAFAHGRFHRDFNIPKAAADRRYDKWLAQLVETKNVYSMYWHGELAGFIGCSGNKVVLCAVAENYRGKGLSKYWGSAIYSELLANGHEIVKGSFSATNLAMFKLYASLGFSFNNPQDVYHRLIA